MAFYTFEQINKSKALQELYKKEYGQQWNGLISKGIKFKKRYKKLKEQGVLK